MSFFFIKFKVDSSTLESWNPFWLINITQQVLLSARMKNNDEAKSVSKKLPIIVNLYLTMILLLRKQEVANHSQFVTKMLLLRTLEWSMGDIKRCLKF
jgi:hypothetical protein